MGRRAKQSVIQALERRTFLSSTQVDLTFGSGGMLLGPASTSDVNDMTVLADGKILVTGPVERPGSLGSDMGVVRYNADGTLDTTFGVGGTAQINVSDLGAAARAMAVQSDGKIVLAGLAGTVPDTSGYQQYTAVRFNADGTLDTTFGIDGKFTLDTGIYGGARAMQLLPDGKILLLGYVRDLSNNGSDLLAIRLTTDGALDATFANNGQLRIQLGTNQQPAALAVQPDGKFIIADNNFGTALKIVRFNNDGTIDTTFADQGVNTIPVGTADPDGNKDLYPFFDSDFSHMVVQDDGKIVLSDSYFDTATSYFTVFRFNADGSFDTAFSGDGRSDLKLPGTTRMGMDVAVQSDGKIVQSGEVGQNFAAVRYNVDGTLDTTFGFNGVVGINVGGAIYSWYGYATAVALTPDGSILLAGKAGVLSRSGVVKLSNDPKITISADGALYIRGTDLADHIELTRDWNDIKISFNGSDYQVHAPLGVLTRVDANGGDDLVIVHNGVGPCVINGGDGNDSLAGGDGNDSISGNAGKDRIDGGGGDDRVAGNGGNDALTGGEGRDRVYGDAGNDAEVGGSGVDRMWGGDGNDLVSGNSGNDILYGDGGINTLAGGAGNDRIYDFATSDIVIFGGEVTTKLIDEKTGLITLIEGLL